MDICVLHPPPYTFGQGGNKDAPPVVCQRETKVIYLSGNEETKIRRRVLF